MGGNKGNEYTVPDVADLLGVGDETVRRYISSGRLKARKVAVIGLKKRWLITQASLDRFRKLIKSDE